MSNGYILEESGMLKRCGEASADLELFMGDSAQPGIKSRHGMVQTADRR